MAKYRDALAQSDGTLFLTDGGMETTLIFLEGQELPFFAAFHLLQTPGGEERLRSYFRTYAELARTHRSGLILETATWRASSDWGDRLGYTADALADVNRECVAMLEEIRHEYETTETPIVISGCIGPRGDGYVPTNPMSAAQAEKYHRAQIETFAGTAADMVTVYTINYVEEAIGITRAASKSGLPVVVSVTVETDGRLPTGQSIGEAIERIDEATSAYAAYFMINCAHPAHFDRAVNGDEPWASRIRGLRANASLMSHAELNEATELDSGDPAALARDYVSLKKHKLKRLNVLGGCCGTDHRHVNQIALACSPLFRRAP